MTWRLSPVGGWLVLLGVGSTAGACGGGSTSGHPEDDSAGAGGIDTGVAGELPVGGTSDPGGGRPAGGEAGAPPIMNVAGEGGGGEGGMGGEPLQPPGSATLGSGCTDTVECHFGLTCLTESSFVLDGGAPPGGLCTLTCTSDVQCTKFSPSAICYPFDLNGFQGYCAEGCEFGASVFRKCHARDDFACLPGLLEDSGVPCEEGCFENELCESGTCQGVRPACLPSCRGDLDCAPGLFCDGGWLRGTCVKEKPPGKKHGEPCMAPGPLDPLEPDECEGFCLSDVEGELPGHCYATCGLGGDCAWDADTGLFGGACHSPSPLTVQGGFGDFGFCTSACSCAAECTQGYYDTCFTWSDVGPLDKTKYRGSGMCWGADNPLNDPVLEACE